MKLLEPCTLGDLALPNRVVMAPMTRNRATGTIPQEMAAVHYAARASAGLIVSEATQVSARGQGYPDTPGLHTAAQAAAWRTVTDAVHRAGGRMFVQLSHVGRLSHSDYHGLQPVAPSAVQVAGFIRTPRGLRPYELPWTPSTSGVRDLVDEFARAAELAKAAGFDGVEIHGASGFLVDQFLQSGTNQRTDRYGGSLENRLRFALEVVEAVSGSWERTRIGFTVSPGGSHKAIRDEAPLETFAGLAAALDRAGISYLHVLEEPISEMSSGALMREHFHGSLVSSGSYTRDLAEEALESGAADLVAFGRAFTANPDLVEKLHANRSLALADPRTFYSGGAAGYIDQVELTASRPASEKG
ncbi:MAG TPA: alkene reductase [bacterium]|nr:alkene reductase [bacterium]